MLKKFSYPFAAKVTSSNRASKSFLFFCNNEHHLQASHSRSVEGIDYFFGICFNWGRGGGLVDRAADSGPLDPSLIPLGEEKENK